jgi:hypothetical protein
VSDASHPAGVARFGARGQRMRDGRSMREIWLDNRYATSTGAGPAVIF